jgi:hypothetical protein
MDLNISSTEPSIAAKHSQREFIALAVALAFLSWSVWSLVVLTLYKILRTTDWPNHNPSHRIVSAPR